IKSWSRSRAPGFQLSIATRRNSFAISMRRRNRIFDLRLTASSAAAVSLQIWIYRSGTQHQRLNQSGDRLLSSLCRQPLSATFVETDQAEKVIDKVADKGCRQSFYHADAETVFRSARTVS